MSNKTNDELKELKKKGVEKIVNDTYISHDIVKAILDKDFDFFDNKAKAIRFIKIINSTYNYALESWINEYLQYLQDNNITDEDISSSTVSIETEYIEQESRDYTSYITIGIVILIILAIIVSFYNFKNDTQELIVSKDKNNTNITQLENTLLQTTTSQTLAVVPLKKNRHKVYAQNTQESINNELDPEISEILDMDIAIDLNKSILAISKNDITITTNLGRIWIGIIDLDTYSKKSDIIEETKTLPIYDNTIIITGHGHLTLESGKDRYNLAHGGKQYFYYKDNSFVKLTRIEYLYLNKGIEW